MKNSLDIRSLKRLSDTLSCRLGVRRISAQELSSLYDVSVPEPVVLRGRNALVWIDRYYAAYRIGCAPVHYAYLTARDPRYL